MHLEAVTVLLDFGGLADDEWRECGSILSEHTDWIKCIAWAQHLGMKYFTLASCSLDKKVIVWKVENCKESVELIEFRVLDDGEFSDTVWKVDWSPTGLLLSVSSGDNNISLWKEEMNIQWKCVSTLNGARIETE